MINIFLILYWIIIVLILVATIMVIYHIWTYYLNRTLAIFTIVLFIIISSLLFLINIIFALKVDWNAVNFLIS
jgi:hypothetical protein